MLRSNSKQSGGIHVVNPEEEKERLRWEGFAEKEGFEPGLIRAAAADESLSLNLRHAWHSRGPRSSYPARPGHSQVSDRPDAMNIR